MNPSEHHLSRRKWIDKVAIAGLGTTLITSPGSSMAGLPDKVAGNTTADGAAIYNIRDFGAKGDGKTLDTKALQTAIDTCNKHKGGTVLIPAGVFMIGTVELKSNVTLHLSAQSKLVGTADGKQYYAGRTIPLDTGWTMNDGNVGLLFAENAENITIEGNGTIDGQGAQFRSPTKGVPPPSGRGGNDRPYHLLFYKCNNLTVRDVVLLNSAYHSVRVCFCTFVKLEGLHIRGRVIHNNDGFHFVASQYVHVSNCHVQTQDDACALFGSCKFVTITNCSFSTRWSVFRFGGGEAENITISNCLIYETYGCPIKMRCSPGGRFENISFSNIVMRDVTGPISIGISPAKGQQDTVRTPGKVKNISFSNIHGNVVKPVPLRDSEFSSNYNPGEIFSCITLNAMDDVYMERISFNNIHLTYPGGGTTRQGAVRDVPKLAGEYYQIGVPPAYGLFARNVKALTLTDIRFEMEQPDERPALILDHVHDAAINGFSAHGQPRAESLLRFISSSDVYASAVRVLSPVTTLLEVEGAQTSNIKIDGGDLSRAAKTLKVSAGADEHAVKIRD